MSFEVVIGAMGIIAITWIVVRLLYVGRCVACSRTIWNPQKWALWSFPE